MGHMLLAAFHNHDHADGAIQEPESLGYATKDISVISKEGGKVVKTDGDDVVDGATSGAVTGGAVGGLAGLLAGAGIFPALAGLMIGGPVAVALGLTGAAAVAVSGAVTGAVAGGLIGALVSLGVPKEVAAYYDETVNEGGVVVAVPVSEDRRDEALRVLNVHHAEEVSTVETAPEKSPTVA